jgi:acyl carrier protein
MTSKNDALQERIVDIIAREGAVERELVKPDATLESLGIKSMDVVMILVGIEEEFQLYIPADESLSHIKDVNGLVADIQRRLAERKAQ